MNRSKLTHAEKDIIIKELETVLTNLDTKYSTMFNEQVEQYTKHILEFVTKQHELIDLLNNQNKGLKAVNWLATALFGISLGVNIYIVWL